MTAFTSELIGERRSEQLRELAFRYDGCYCRFNYVSLLTVI